MATETTNHTETEQPSDLVISLIDDRTADPSAYLVPTLDDAVESRRVYDFRLPRGHIGRRRPRLSGLR